MPLKVTILILIDGFLQSENTDFWREVYKGHNPYFNRWFSAIPYLNLLKSPISIVTILILIDGFLQLWVKLSNVKLTVASQSLF